MAKKIFIFVLTCDPQIQNIDRFVLSWSQKPPISQTTKATMRLTLCVGPRCVVWALGGALGQQRWALRFFSTSPKLTPTHLLSLLSQMTACKPSGIVLPDIKTGTMGYANNIDMIVELKCFWDFKKGDEKALTGLYDKLYKPLLYHGLRIIKDRFVVNSIIQEAFLKAWNFRERMTSTLHLYRFIRLNITWGCYGYFRQATYKRHYGNVVYTDNIDFYTIPSCFESEVNERLQQVDEEKLQAIYNVIPYLPATRQNLINLYFKYGFSYKQIADRYATSKQAIGRELQKGLEHLKKVINSKKKLDKPAVNVKDTLSYNELLEGEMLQVFKLRYEMKLSFESIAIQLNLAQPYIQQQYVAAHIKIQQLTKKNK